jgi:hypothetical protein
MEWTVPIQSIDINHITLSDITREQKLMATISYRDEVASMTALSMLLPTMTINSYNKENGHLVLQIPPTHSKKLHGIQDHILKIIRARQRGWFPDFKARPEARPKFQPIIDGDLLHVYCPVGTGGPYDIHTYHDGWTTGANDVIEAGKNVRIIIRIQGVSFHQNPLTGIWTGKFRLQHRILAIYVEKSGTL